MHQDYIQKPVKELDCEEFRYNHRFGPFQFFSMPPVCLYYQFKEKDEQFIHSFTPEKIYSFAQDHFEQARAIYEKYPDAQHASACAKVAKNNFVVMRLLSSGLKKTTVSISLNFILKWLFFNFALKKTSLFLSKKIDFDFTDHPHFPMIKF